MCVCVYIPIHIYSDYLLSLLLKVVKIILYIFNTYYSDLSTCTYIRINRCVCVCVCIFSCIIFQQ